MNAILEFYRRPGLATDPKQHCGLLVGLPGEVSALRDVLQEMVVHIFWSERYGLELSEERKSEVQIRPVWRKLEQLQRLEGRPLWEPRPLERRLVCNCRDFSVLFTSMLMEKGIPARARCGFGTYFIPGHFEDHWVVEYWNASAERWVMVDTQLDALQREVLRIDFDPLDMPAGKFITGGEAWKMCRDGRADPDQFGIQQWKGWDFVRGNVVRDFAALNKVEVLPWDFWGVLLKPVAESGQEGWALVDRLADLTVDSSAEGTRSCQSLFASEPRWQPPQEWFD